MADGSVCSETGKKCYGRREAARKISWFKKKNRRCVSVGKCIPARYYLCKFCGMYHLTHYRNKR